MVLSEPERKRRLRETHPSPSTKIERDREVMIGKFLHQIKVAKFVTDIRGNVYEVDFIAGDEVHIVPMDKGSRRVDPKGKTSKLMKIDPEDMIGEFQPCSMDGRIIRHPQKRFGRDTNERQKIVKPVDDKLRKEAELASRSHGRVNRLDKPVIEKPFEKGYNEDFRKPQKGPADSPFKKDPEIIDGKPGYHVDTPYAKTEAERKRQIEKRKSKIANERVA